MTNGTQDKIDEIMEKATAALKSGSYFEAERLADQALQSARRAEDFVRMARIILPLQEARRQRIMQALDAAESVTILDEVVPEPEADIAPGAYLIRPPLVGADARRFRLAALRAEVPVAVVCREPLTLLRDCPIVAIGQVTIRTKIDPPDDPDHPAIEWFVDAMEALGDAAVASLDTGLEIDRQIDALIACLDSIPDHEGLHQRLIEACEEAQQAGMG
jgi:hypothetical protein